MVTATDIPEVMQFLRANASPDLHFAIQTGVLPRGQSRSGEPDLVISELMTEQILAVTNEANLTNYSFQLRVDTAPYYEGEVSFFNLVVKETTAVEGYYAYIQEYRMDENWYVGNGSILEMQTYTGKMIFYTLEGLYLARVNFSNGQIIGEDIRSPCPNDDPGGGDPGGGGSGSGPGVGDGGSGGGTGGGSGTGGGGIQIIVIGCTCYTPPHQPGESCTCENPPYIIIVWGSEIDDINETLRNPCCPPCDVPDQCNYPNGDPCPCNATNDGCIEQNPNVGTIYTKPHPDCTILNEIIEDQQTKSKIEQLQTQFGNSYESGFNLYKTSQQNVNSSNIYSGNWVSFPFSNSINVFGGVHLHHNGTFPMFSLDDVLIPNQFYNNFNDGNPPDKVNPTLIMVSPQGVYAIKIDNLQVFQDFVEFMMDEKEYKKNFRQLVRIYNNTKDPITGQQGNSIMFQKAFLKFFTQDNNAGISLYKMTNDLSIWNRIVLNESGTPTPSFSCN